MKRDTRSERPRQPAPGSMRVFVALELPEEWHAALVTLQETLRADGLRLRFVRPEGIHLTLAFLGDMEPERLVGVQQALDGIETPSGIRLRLGGCGLFGSARRPRVVWAGVAGDLERLAALQRSVEQALAPVGYRAQYESFRAHLTLARVPESLSASDAQRIAPALTHVQAPAVTPFDVTGFALFRSESAPGGQRYTVLQRWPSTDWQDG